MRSDVCSCVDPDSAAVTPCIALHLRCLSTYHVLSILGHPMRQVSTAISTSCWSAAKLEFASAAPFAPSCHALQCYSLHGTCFESVMLIDCMRTSARFALWCCSVMSRMYLSLKCGPASLSVPTRLKPSWGGIVIGRDRPPLSWGCILLGTSLWHVAVVLVCIGVAESLQNVGKAIIAESYLQPQHWRRTHYGGWPYRPVWFWREIQVGCAAPPVVVTAGGGLPELGACCAHRTRQ